MLLIDDIQMIQECLNGNVESFGPVVRKYEKPLVRTAYRFLGNWDDAKDATQDTFIKTYRSLDTFQQDRCFSTWIYRILVNVCLDRLKSAHRRYQSQLSKPIQDRNNPNPLDRLAEKELLQKTLNRLPIKRRRALILVDLEGFSSPEAAKIIGCSKSTVRVTVMKARKQLRKIYLELNKF